MTEPMDRPFGDHALEYYDSGLHPFPVRVKVPAVKGWRHRQYSRQTIKKWTDDPVFQSLNIGVPTGARSGLTVIDIDSPDLRDFALERFGRTPVLVQTGTAGHLQAYYRHDGESNRHKLFGMAIDVRGEGGMIVAPPSITNGPYRFESGSIRNLRDLPPIAPGSLKSDFDIPPVERKPAKPIGQMRDGDGRNDTLFKRLRGDALSCDEEAALLSIAHARNSQFDEPLPDTEVRKTVGSVWKYKQDGKLWGDGEARSVITASELEFFCGESDAVYLLMEARRHHGARNEPFAFGKAMAQRIDWGYRKFKKARDKLCEAGFLVCVHQGGRWKGDSSRYILSKENPLRG